MCEISIIFVLICQKLGSIRPIQQKTKLLLPYLFYSIAGFHFYMVKYSNGY